MRYHLMGLTEESFMPFLVECLDDRNEAEKKREKLSKNQDGNYWIVEVTDCKHKRKED